MRVGSDWNHYTYVYGDDKTARVTFDVEAAVLPNDAGDRGVRFKTTPPLTRDELVEALGGVEVWLVGELHYADAVEFVLQVPPTLTNDDLANSLPGHTLEWTPGWDYFDDRICPTPADWRRIQDREALDRLDLDLDGVLQILHRFYGDATGLEAIASRLEAEGFATVDRSDTRMTLAHSHPIGDVSRITLGLLRLCEKNGVAYDGWVLPS
jgi:hypothetical protein